MGNYSKKRVRSRAEEKELESAYRKVSGSGRSKRKQKKSNRSAAVIAICVALVAIVIGLAAGYLYFEHLSSNGVILENIYIAGVDVGGMTQAEAIEAVRPHSNTYSNTPMVVKVLDGQTELSTAYLNSLDIQAAVKDAYKFGNTGTQAKREREKKIAQAEGYVVDLTEHLGMDTEAIKNALSEFGTQYSSVLSQSSYEVTGSSPNQVLIIKLGVPEYGLDLNALYEQVVDAYNRCTFVVEGKCDMIEPKDLDLEAILNEYYIAPTDAAFDSKTFEIIEGKDGYGFDLEAAKNQLKQAKYGSTIEIPFTAIKPKITAQELSTTLYKDTLATYTASTVSDSNRNVNLRLACEAINGKVLMPGDVFSYNETLGERTEKKGYKPADAYLNGETVKELGGGICQVSSALYYCALLSDLEILTRENHGFASDYVPLGMDSAISWGSLDFRFRNSTEYPIRIDASAEGGDVTVTLVGTDTKDYYIKMEYDVLNTYDYAVTYKTYSANNAAGYKNGDYIVKPYTGYDVKTYRCKYSKQDDSLLSKNFEDESKYKSRDGIICKIPNSTESTPRPNLGIGGGAVTDAPGALEPE